MDKTVTLYRPVGPKELDLIRASGFSRFPPRLADQPIFYPVVEEDYAHQIARDWNVKASGAGFVTRFKVRADFLKPYELKRVGGNQHHEYWIPADRLEEFNDSLVGAIEVIAEYKEEKRGAIMSDENKVMTDAEVEEKRRSMTNVLRKYFATDTAGKPEVVFFWQGG